MKIDKTLIRDILVALMVMGIVIFIGKLVLQSQIAGLEECQRVYNQTGYLVAT